MRNPSISTEDNATEIAEGWYNRTAPLYDLMEGSCCSRWRELLSNKVEGTWILELGVGAGKNYAYSMFAFEVAHPYNLK